MVTVKKAFVVANGTARDLTPTSQGRFFPADLLGSDTHEIERVMRLRYSAETRDEVPELINSVRTGSDDDLLHLALLFGDVEGVRSAVLEGLHAVESAKGSIANFAQAISLLKIREAAPVLHAHLGALPLGAPPSSFRASAIASCLLILDDTDDVAAAALAAQLMSTIRAERMFAAHRACECDRHKGMTPALNAIRIAAARFVDDDDDVFIAAAPLFLIMSTNRSSDRLRGLLRDPPNDVLLLTLIRDALNHGLRDEEITPVVVERGLAHSSPGVRLDSVTLLDSLPRATRVGLAKQALLDESDNYLRDMLSRCAAKP